MSYYNNIDNMPLFNWRKCQEGDLNYCRKDTDKGDVKKDVEHWDLVYNSYIIEFGLGKEYQHILNLQWEKAVLECDLVITGDNFLQNKIRQIERELESIFNQSVEYDTGAVIIHLSKWMGGIIDERTITVWTFYKALNEYKRSNQPN